MAYTDGAPIPAYIVMAYADWAAVSANTQYAAQLFTCTCGRLNLGAMESR